MNDSIVKKIFYLDEMITPKVITYLYWLSLVGIVIAGISVMASLGGVAGFFSGLFYILIGAVVARIWCELIIVLFKINEALQYLKNKE